MGRVFTPTAVSFPQTAVVGVVGGGIVGVATAGACAPSECLYPIRYEEGIVVQIGDSFLRGGH